MLDSFKSLVLNYSYEPLQFCSARHAIIMVFGGRAEELDSAGYTVHTPSTSFQLPTVIRVLKMVRRKRKKTLSFSKKNILRRDNYTCQYCGTSNHPLTVDHVVPKSRGGGTNWTNIVVACKTCNLKKADRTPLEVDMKLRKPPGKPEYHFISFVIPSGPESHVEIWQKYLPENSATKSVAF
ncbi:MAG: HNH endonuclease [Nitrospinae bacterium CG22_combo_CG10-13_8_21_14_all_47_10]|nr:MAG: HNH endonuclease [Nitrospinae bacterium CG22_combo_CG10-13_8_21_14_all_47_10]